MSITINQFDKFSGWLKGITIRNVGNRKQFIKKLSYVKLSFLRTMDETFQLYLFLLDVLVVDLVKKYLFIKIKQSCI